ncbi:MAG TPA: CoA ester lyase [Caulobacteraceae bacterium]|nr:CoA ester lyase [Caulobacteraceae bacterium]
MIRPRRSVLFLPASNARAVDKARGLACDVAVLDLEDAVGPEHKADARAAMAETLRTGGFGAREVVVRVNGLDTEWGEQDLAAAAAAGPDAILVPKVRTAEDVRDYDRRIAGAPAGTRLWAMVETCASVLNLREIAGEGASGRLSALVVGVNDLSKEMRARRVPDRAPLQAALTLTVAAARAHGLIALDGVHNDLDDAQGLEAECRQGRDFGFDGKCLIHPRQIDVANRAFSPDPAEIAWARAVVEAFEAPQNAGAGVICVEGRMAERLHLDEARRTLALAAAW